jgi:accessory gene regulator B
MNFIDACAIKCTSYIRSNYKDAASEKVLFYALSLSINSFVAISVSLLIATISGHFLKALYVIIFYTLLRFFSGGLHFSTSLRCCFYSILLFTFTSHLEFGFSQLHIGTIITLVSAVILLVTAPQGIKNHSRIDEKFYPLLKMISFAIVISNLYFESSVLAFAYFIQALQTTRLGYTIILYIEKLLNYTIGKGEKRHEG